MRASSNRVVVTGMGELTPLGLSTQATWEAMLQGKSGAAPITYFDTAEHATKFACELKGYDPVAFLDRKSVNRMDRYCQYAVIAAEQALKQSGLDLSVVDTSRFGVVFGSGIGGFITYDEQFRNYLDGGPRRVSPFFIPMMIPDMGAGMISIRNGLRGPNYATVSACSTSMHALIDACMIIRNGLADYMICGGAEASVTPMAVAGFNASKALSTRNDDPATASRPYDVDRDGFVLGEGAGALVLERLDFALERGATIYAEVCGLGMSADAYHMTAPHPEGTGAMLSMKMALKDADITPDQIDHVNAHGTSTPLGDVAEIQAMKMMFGDHARNLNINSTKSMTGHLLGATGAVESIACIMALMHQVVPPTINVFNQDPQVDLNVTANVPQERRLEYALNNGFGFGGHNATIVFRRFDPSNV